MGRVGIDNKKLTDKQRKFCTEYLFDLNATQAAIRAGYSKKTAKEQGHRLLTNVHIQQYVSEQQRKLQISTGITTEMVVRELASIGFSRIDDFVTVEEMEQRTPAEPSEDEHETFEDEITTYKAVDIKLTKDVSADKIPAIASIKQGREGIEVKLHEKVKALELLGKHLGIFEKDNAQRSDITIKKVGFDKDE